MEFLGKHAFSQLLAHVRCPTHYTSVWLARATTLGDRLKLMQVKSSFGLSVTVGLASHSLTHTLKCASTYQAAHLIS